jgi:hypothetical protein
MRPTFTAVPQRRLLLATKALVLGASRLPRAYLLIQAVLHHPPGKIGTRERLTLTWQPPRTTLATPRRSGRD